MQHVTNRLNQYSQYCNRYKSIGKQEAVQAW